MSTLTDIQTLAVAVTTYAQKTADKDLADLAVEITNLAGADTEHVYVANTGLLKAGKSSLFNALVGNEAEFKTAEVRCTVANQHSQQGDFVLVDTPGIDADDADTAEAEATLKQADLILFVHNVKAGELDRVELAYLEQLRRFFPEPGDLRRRILPVFSRIDEVEPGEFVAIMDRSLRQWQDLLGFVPDQHFFTSSKRYFTGIRQDKPIFIQKSGIEPLRDYLQQHAASLRQRKKALLADRAADRLEVLGSRFDVIRRQLAAEAKATLSQRQSNRNRLKKQAAEMFDALSARAQDYLDMPTGTAKGFINYEQIAGIWQSTAAPADVVNL